MSNSTCKTKQGNPKFDLLERSLRIVDSNTAARFLGTTGFLKFMVDYGGALGIRCLAKGSPSSGQQYFFIEDLLYLKDADFAAVLAKADALRAAYDVTVLPQAKKLGKQFGTLEAAGYNAVAFADNDDIKVLGQKAE